MARINNLNPGMHVKIVDSWPGYVGQALNGSMNQWLGQIVTISRAYGDGSFRIEEDLERWLWTTRMIDSIILDCAADFEPASESDLFAMLGLEVQ